LNEKIAKVFRFANISVIRSSDVRWIGAAANKLELLISADLEAEYPHEFLLLALKERDYDAVFNFAVTQRRHEVLLAHVLMRSGRDDQARAVFGAVRSYLDAENSDNWDLVLDLEGKYFGEKFDSYLTYAYRDLGDFHMQDDWRSYEKLVRVLLAVSRYGSSSVKQPFLDKVSERLMIPISQGRSGAASILNFRLSASACIAHLRGNGEMRNALLRLLNKVDVNEENLIELVFVPAQIMYTCGQRDISWLYAEDFINLSMKVDRKDRDLIVAVSEAYEILGDDKELGLYLDKTVAEIGTSEMGGASSLDDWRSIGRIMEVYGAFLTGLSVEQYRSLN
jgi:hypothetical protein